MFNFIIIIKVSTLTTSIFRVVKKARHFWKNMDCPDLHPPSSVRGMVELDREAFQKTIKVPTLVIPEEDVNKIRPYMKKLLLKMEKLKPVRFITSHNGGQHDKEFLLHPLAVKGWHSLPQELSKFGITQKNFSFSELELIYDNWKADEILKSVLPEDNEGLTSFSRIGHIVHINLRDHLLPYKNLIGAVLKDKTVGCRTVVNKAQTIHNTYRNFQVELVCGDPDYKVEVKENGVPFEFDFSKVYWNPRLSTEHERIVDLLKSSDIFYDVFAGVGPFSIPAAVKKKCEVFANDLNPESYKWLNYNVKRNKCLDRVKTFNKDGNDFILQDIKEDLKQRFLSKNVNNIHIVMNLPAMAVEFLPTFQGLMFNENIMDKDNIKYPMVHVYSFAKGENTKDLVSNAVETNLGSILSDNLDGIYFVRNVAPNKDMYRISFYLTEEILFSNNKKRNLSEDERDSNSKRICS